MTLYVVSMNVLAEGLAAARKQISALLEEGGQLEQAVIYHSSFEGQYAKTPGETVVIVDGLMTAENIFASSLAESLELVFASGDTILVLGCMNYGPEGTGPRNAADLIYRALGLDSSVSEKQIRDLVLGSNREYDGNVRRITGLSGD